MTRRQRHEGGILSSGFGKDGSGETESFAGVGRALWCTEIKRRKEEMPSFGSVFVSEKVCCFLYVA